jgi:excisionase family DNA binding protein
MQPEADLDERQWMSLQEASELLGVTVSTVRRWGDAGRLPQRRTLGGHRRLQRAAVEQLAARVKPQPIVVAQPPVGRWGVDATALAGQAWHARLTASGDASRMRGIGQRLLGVLIQYINRREEDERYLQEVRGIGLNYGAEARSAGISMHDTVEAFLFFRSSFAQLAQPLPTLAQPHDLADAAVLQGRIGHFMDALLLGTIDGYEGRS